VGACADDGAETQGLTNDATLEHGQTTEVVERLEPDIAGG
jgi:hypothetical protein